jgi:hypothetical protein
LAGLSPAAKLARQHTLRSKAEQARRGTGEPTWDNNTQTRNGAPVLPSIESLTSGLSTLSTGTGPEVVRVQPRSTQTVVHAVNVADHEYDSEDDSSDGETIEDATIGIAKARFSQDTERSNGETDDDFKARWGSIWIDRNAVPKKGILKRMSYFVFGLMGRIPFLYRRSTTSTIYFECWNTSLSWSIIQYPTVKPSSYRWTSPSTSSTLARS